MDQVDNPATEPQNTAIPVLCYVNGRYAYFTTQPINEQWGDDWNDAPYEHNAGDPYYYVKGFRESETPWEVVVIRFDGPYETPGERANGNSQWSVEDINRRYVAWLIPTNEDVEPIFANTPIDMFKKMVKQAGGKIYIEEPNL
jgi:hypothetical protein